MCGRYTFHAGNDIFDRFSLNPDYERGIELNSNYNVSPGQFMPIVFKEENSNQLSLMRWGLIPSWAKDPKIGYKMFNARADSVFFKPSFKASFRRRRCLVPANGFFEWKTENKKKTPFYYTLKDQSLFAFAGLWDKWLDPNGAELQTYTIITTDPNNLVQIVHNRMPVILKLEEENIWLGENSEEETLVSLLKPYPSELMESVEKGPNAF